MEDLEWFLDVAIVCGDEYLDYHVCQYALVAAAVVDAILNKPDWELLTDVQYENDDEYLILFIELKETREEAEKSREKAVKALGLAVKADSELREL
ncbi:DUF4259 domain-containing protein [Lachnospiraceae bacterium NSJ-143]|nr:DUF4259 domain-containing protein [Lachnospiraceae bacterium NSJ-143]